MKLTKKKCAVFLSGLILYILIRMAAYLLCGGYTAILNSPFMVINIVLCIFVYLAFVAAYLFMKKKINNKPLLAFSAIFLAMMLAYFTMEDFHKIFRLSPYAYSLEQKSIIDSIKSTYFEGFNFIAWTISIGWLLFRDLKVDEVST